MITEFKNDYRWLSNFAPVNITYKGIVYPSVEHAYMSAKSDDEGWKKFCANANNYAGDVKRKSRTVKLVANWEEIKVSVMEECLRQKFSKQPFKSKLLSTGDVLLQEGNFWGDKFWGGCMKTGQGRNVLGELIMNIRKQYAQQTLLP